MSLTGNTNEEKIWNFLKAKGLNACGIAGLMGNLYAESALRPNNLPKRSWGTRMKATRRRLTAASIPTSQRTALGMALRSGLITPAKPRCWPSYSPVARPLVILRHSLISFGKSCLRAIRPP